MHIALLRAINVGGRFYRMADLKACLEESGLEDVETYIQSGNVRFTTPMRSSAKVEQHLEYALGSCCGFSVATIVRSPRELAQVYADAQSLPSPLGGEPRRYVTFLKNEPTTDAVERLSAWDFEEERASVVGRAVHIWLNRPAHTAKISNARIERIFGAATTRDLKVVRTLAERWGA